MLTSTSSSSTVCFYIDITCVGVSPRAFTIKLQLRIPSTDIYINGKPLVTMVTHVIPHCLAAGPDSKLVAS